MPHHSYRHWAPPLGERTERRLPLHKPVTNDDPDAPADQHSHRTPRGIKFSIIGLTVVMALILAALIMFIAYTLELKQHRDGENARLKEQIRQGNCGLLDELPADWDALDPLRQDNGCGPGLPFEDLPPELQRQLASSGPAQLRAPAGIVLDPGDAGLHDPIN